MNFWRVIAVMCIATAFVQSKSTHHQKRATRPNICDLVYNNTLDVRCYCTKDNQNPKIFKSADCFLFAEHVKPEDDTWTAFDYLKDVTKLTFTKNNITMKYIPTEALKYTKSVLNLDIKYGNIEKVGAYAFANLSAVQEITLRGNQIKILEVNAFADHKDLAILGLDTNAIVEINRDVFVHLPSLEKLYLTNNKITTLHDRAFGHLNNLKEIEIDRNNIFSLNSETFSGLKKLQKLDLSSNSLEVIGDNTFLPLVNLRSLNLDGNKIQMLDNKAFFGLSSLQSLSLAHNNIVDIDNLKVFEGLKSLISLNLRGNKIKILKAEVMAPILTNFYGGISTLDVDDNSFPCSCQLDWFTSLMNKTQNENLKLALNNLKCQPDAALREAWSKTEEIEKNTTQTTEDEETQFQNPEYEYYDDTQLDGKFFYVDVRDLLNCTKGTKTKSEITTTTRKSPTAANTKAPSPYTTTTVKTELNKELTTKPDPKLTTKYFTTETSVTQGHTTAKMAAAVTKPPENHVFAPDATSVEAKPDKIKAHRSIQEKETPDYLKSGANINLGCVMLLAVILYLIH